MASVPGGLLEWWFDGGTDLAEDVDAARFERLVAGADILLESAGPGQLLDAARIAALNPRLTHVVTHPVRLRRTARRLAVERPGDGRRRRDPLGRTASPTNR